MTSVLEAPVKIPQPDRQPTPPDLEFVEAAANIIVARALERMPDEVPGIQETRTIANQRRQVHILASQSKTLYRFPKQVVTKAVQLRALTTKAAEHLPISDHQYHDYDSSLSRIDPRLAVMAFRRFRHQMELLLSDPTPTDFRPEHADIIEQALLRVMEQEPGSYDALQAADVAIRHRLLR
jgi:hypothetical protein